MLQDDLVDPDKVVVHHFRQAVKRRLGKSVSLLVEVDDNGHEHILLKGLGTIGPVRLFLTGALRPASIES